MSSRSKMMDTARKWIRFTINQWWGLHAARATRPDIAHAVGIVSKFNSEPTEAHLTAVKRIFRYLKGTLDLVLQYKSTGRPLLGYSDADWESDLDNRHSTSGNVFVMSGGAISWLRSQLPYQRQRQSMICNPRSNLARTASV